MQPRKNEKILLGDVCLPDYECEGGMYDIRQKVSKETRLRIQDYGLWLWPGFHNGQLHFVAMFEVTAGLRYYFQRWMWS